MLVRTLAVFLLLLSAPASAEEPELVTFAYAPLKSGETLREAGAMTLGFSAEILVAGTSMGTSKSKMTESRDRAVRVGPRWDAAHKEATVSFGRVEEASESTMPDGQVQNERKESAVSGRTFVVVQERDAEATVTGQDGTPATPEQREAVLEVWEELPGAEATGFEGTLAGRTVRVGEALETDVERLSELLGFDGDEELKLSSGQVRLAGTREVGGVRCAILGLEMVVTGADSEMAMTMNLRGEAALGIDDLRVRTMGFSGPVTISARFEEGDIVMTLAGGGNFEMALTNEWGAVAK